MYEKITPYREFQLINQDNVAAAISLSGALFGFTFPLLTSIFYTQSLLEVIFWASVTGLVQFALSASWRGTWAKQIEQGKVAPAIFVAASTMAMGLLNAVCISH